MLALKTRCFYHGEFHKLSFLLIYSSPAIFSLKKNNNKNTPCGRCVQLLVGRHADTSIEIALAAACAAPFFIITIGNNHAALLHVVRSQNVLFFTEDAYSLMLK